MEKENPKIEWIKKSGKDCLKFTFSDKLNIEDANLAIKKWKKAFAEKPQEKIIIIWECSEMSGYDNEARIQWQKTLRETENQIASIWLITTSNIIKLGAAVMSLFISLKINTVSSENEINIKTD